MIQYPNNVKPQNQAFDATAGTMYIKFTFNGDYLSGICTRITDYDTGSLVRETWYQGTDRLPLAYNGDEVQNSINNPNLVNGGRYVFQMMLVQRTSDGLSPICDMPVIGDKVLLNASNTDTIYIAKDITAIYPWGKNGDVYTPKTVVEGQSYFNPMEIKIGNVTRTIVSYTDNVEVDGQIYGQLVLDGNVSANAGDYFRIYSNSVITPQYFFKCNSTPVMVSHSHLPTSSGQLKVEWRYTQAEGVPMKYYILRLWWSNNHLFEEDRSRGERVRLIEETNRIYSQLVSYNFESPYYHDCDATYPDGDDYYKIEIEGVTQDGVSFTDYEEFSIAPHDCRDAPDESGRRLRDFYIAHDLGEGFVSIHLRGYIPFAHEHYELFRKELRYNEAEKKYIPIGEDELVGWTHLEYVDENGLTLKGNDVSVPVRGVFQYTLLLFGDDGGVIIPSIDNGYINIDVEGNEEVAEILDEIAEKGININQTVYGNIDTNDRQVLEWTSANLTRFEEAYTSWGYETQELAGSISTVMGASSEFDDVEIAFSPILQTEDGAVLLDEYTVSEYIWGLIDVAGESWTSEDLLRLDIQGLEFDGLMIKKLIADIGDSAIQTGEAMHYTGRYGALALALRNGDFPTNKIEFSESAYYITALNEAVGTSSLVHQDDIAKRKTYRLGDTWKFAGEIANTTVTNNLDTMVHVGYGQYISTTSTEVNYMSGVLSAMIGYVDCVNHKYVDDIDLVKAWRKFITQKVPFLLKSQKGDVWVVNVSENPTTEYDETVSSIPTTISFAWAECDSIDNIILKDIAQ